MRFKPAPAESCPTCGMAYRDFRTGMTYGEVYAEFWCHDDDRARWRNKRRGTVLGRWRAHKIDLWGQHQAWCAEEAGEVPF